MCNRDLRARRQFAWHLNGLAHPSHNVRAHRCEKWRWRSRFYRIAIRNEYLRKPRIGIRAICPILRRPSSWNGMELNRFSLDNGSTVGPNCCRAKDHCRCPTRRKHSPLSVQLKAPRDAVGKEICAPFAHRRCIVECAIPGLRYFYRNHVHRPCLRCGVSSILSYACGGGKLSGHQSMVDALIARRA